SGWQAFFHDLATAYGGRLGRPFSRVARAAGGAGLGDGGEANLVLPRCENHGAPSFFARCQSFGHSPRRRRSIVGGTPRAGGSELGRRANRQDNPPIVSCVRLLREWRTSLRRRFPRSKVQIGGL